MLSGLVSPNFPFLAVVPLVAGWLLGDWPVRRGVFLAVDVQQATEGLHWRYRAPGGPSQKALLVAELAQERYSAVVPSATLDNTACSVIKIRWSLSLTWLVSLHPKHQAWEKVQYLPKQHNGRFATRSSFDLTAFVAGCFFLLHLCHLRELRCVVVKHLLALFVASHCLCLVALTCQAPRRVPSQVSSSQPLHYRPRYYHYHYHYPSVCHHDRPPPITAQISSRHP